MDLNLAMVDDHHQSTTPTIADGGGDGKVTASAKDKAEDTAKGKDDDDGSHRCANCDKPDAKSKCGRCGVEWYCDHDCQKVSRGAGRVSAMGGGW